jgi:hypothetical protein
MRKIALGFIAAVAILIMGGASQVSCRDTPPFTQPGFKKVFVVVFENTDAEDALKQPFFARIAEKGAYFDDFRAITHPSYPNYIAMTSGSVHGVKKNDPVTVDVRHLGDLLEEKGLSWKSYAEGYPGGCDLRPKIGKYARKHAPMINYNNVQTHPERCARIVGESELDDDIANGTLPHFSLYIPDNDNNGHDTGVEFADRYLERKFGPLLDDPRFMKDMLFVVTFDESGGNKTNRIYTAFYGDSVVPGSRSEFKWTLYDLLRTIEESFGLGTLGLEDQKAKPISGIWKSST